MASATLKLSRTGRCVNFPLVQTAQILIEEFVQFFYKNLLTKCEKCGIIKGWGGKPRDNGRNERFFQFVKYFHILFTKNSHLPIPFDFPKTQHAEPSPAFSYMQIFDIAGRSWAN